MNLIAETLPVFVVVFVLIYSVVKRISIFSVFVTGAKKGVQTTLDVMPTLIGIITAITMLSNSGAIDAFVLFSKDFFAFLNIPSEIVPLAIIRPLSGSGANSAVINIFEIYGVDSFFGTVASVLSCSSETTFYVVSVYLSSYKKLSYTIPVALLGDVLAVILSVLVVRIMM